MADNINPKSKTPISFLQEMCKILGITPQYDLLADECSLNQPLFVYKVVAGQIIGNGKGASKKKAKHNAAVDATTKMLVMPEFQQLSPNPQFPSLGPLFTNGDEATGNPVGELQEATQKRMWPSPEYEYCIDEGPPHDREFICSVKVFTCLERANGKSKKLAKRNAASLMLERIKQGHIQSPRVPPLSDNPDPSFIPALQNQVYLPPTNQANNNQLNQTSQSNKKKVSAMFVTSTKTSKMVETLHKLQIDYFNPDVDGGDDGGSGDGSDAEVNSYHVSKISEDVASNDDKVNGKSIFFNDEMIAKMNCMLKKKKTKKKKSKKPLLSTASISHTTASISHTTASISHTTASISHTTASISHTTASISHTTAFISNYIYPSLHTTTSQSDDDEISMKHKHTEILSKNPNGTDQDISETDENNIEDGEGYRSQNNEGEGYRSQNNEGEGYRSQNNEGEGYRSQNNEGEGYRSQNNEGEGYRSQNNEGGDGYKSQNNSSPPRVLSRAQAINRLIQQNREKGKKEIVEGILEPSESRSGNIKCNEVVNDDTGHQHDPFMDLLDHLAEEQKFQVYFHDLPSPSSDGLFQCVLNLSCTPPLVSHGTGHTSYQARKQACYSALKHLKLLTKRMN